MSGAVAPSASWRLQSCGQHQPCRPLGSCSRKHNRGNAFELRHLLLLLLFRCDLHEGCLLATSPWHQLCNMCRHTRETDSRGAGTTRHHPAPVFDASAPKNPRHHHSCPPRGVRRNFSNCPHRELDRRLRFLLSTLSILRENRDDARGLESISSSNIQKIVQKRPVLMQNMYSLPNQALPTRRDLPKNPFSVFRMQHPDTEHVTARYKVEKENVPCFRVRTARANPG